MTVIGGPRQAPDRPDRPDRPNRRRRRRGRRGRRRGRRGRGQVVPQGGLDAPAAPGGRPDEPDARDHSGICELGVGLGCQAQPCPVRPNSAVGGGANLCEVARAGVLTSVERSNVERGGNGCHVSKVHLLSLTHSLHLQQSQDLDRAPTGSRQDPDRTPTGPRQDPDRTPTVHDRLMTGPQ